MKVNRELLEQQLRDAVANYEDRRQHNKRVSRSVLVLSASISGLTTVLIGLSASLTSPAGKIIGLIALGTSASVSVIGAWDSLFNHKRLWILYTEHWISMWNLLMDLEHLKKNGDADDSDYLELYHKFKEIKNSLNLKWQAMKLEDFNGSKQSSGGTK
jgi:hypothetical protein